MIKLLDNYDCSGLRQSHYSGLIRAHFETYGAGYDFCRFYGISYRKPVGAVCVFNGSAVADFCSESKLRDARRELSEFIEFVSPESIELPPELVPRQGFSGYTGVMRTFFEISPAETSEGIFAPPPEAVFNTALRESGANYGLWLTDTMKRVNSRRSALYGYESSVLTVRFSDSGNAYITDVRTPPEDRGKGYARRLLGAAAKILADSGMSAYLSAREEAAGYYRHIGCKEIASDRIFIKK